jgi:hypothetical protein
MLTRFIYPRFKAKDVKLALRNAEGRALGKWLRKFFIINTLIISSGGEGGIRTPDTGFASITA